MQEVFIIMAILGCADEGGPCQMLNQIDAPFNSVAACNAASPAVLERLTDLAYPVIMAQCQEQATPVVAAARSPRPQS